MCGIAGLMRLSGVDPEPVIDMLRALRHRGPDDAGIKRLGPTGAPWAALGIRRLSIVDPSGGHQPISDPSGRYWLTFNGEIYNHRRLRQELIADGVELRTHSDSEVLVTLVARLGLRSALERCCGMFSFALADTRHRRLWLVRDRMGVKPLYWTQRTDGAVVWSSELRGLRVACPRTPSLSLDALRAYLLFEYIPEPWSIFEDHHKLEPGMWLEIDEQGLRHHRWWTPPVPEAGHDGDLGRWARSVHGALQVAVRQRLDADVPVAALLSGGLDSSGVAAIATRRGGVPLTTFSASVDHPGFDEAPAAREVATHLGSHHIEVPVPIGSMGALLQEVGRHMDEPLADSSLLPTWALMRAVKDAGFRCVLSGDGADESFGGYPTHLAHRLAGGLSPLRGLVARAAARLPTSSAGVSRDYMARRFALGLGLPLPRRHQVWMGAWTDTELLGASDAVWQRVDEHGAASAQTSVASQAMYLDQRLYLTGGVLVKVDRASMAHGVEVRSPFLDHRMVELAAQIGDGFKIRGRQDKRVLRDALAQELPAAVCARPKKGFGGPVGPWLRGDGKSVLNGLEDVIPELIEPATVRRVRDEHLDGTADHRRRLWTLVMLRAWRESRWGV